MCDGVGKESEMSLDATIHLPSIDCELPLRDVYDKVEISVPTEAPYRNGHQG